MNLYQLVVLYTHCYLTTSIKICIHMKIFLHKNVKYVLIYFAVNVLIIDSILLVEIAYRSPKDKIIIISITAPNTILDTDCTSIYQNIHTIKNCFSTFAFP